VLLKVSCRQGGSVKKFGSLVKKDSFLVRIKIMGNIDYIKQKCVDRRKLRHFFTEQELEKYILFIK